MLQDHHRGSSRDVPKLERARGHSPFVDIGKRPSADALKALISVYINGKAVRSLWDLLVSGSSSHAVLSQVQHRSRAHYMYNLYTRAAV